MSLLWLQWKPVVSTGALLSYITVTLNHQDIREAIRAWAAHTGAPPSLGTSSPPPAGSISLSGLKKAGVWPRGSGRRQQCVRDGNSQPAQLRVVLKGEQASSDDRESSRLSWVFIFRVSHGLLIGEGGISLYDQWRYRWEPSGASSLVCQSLVLSLTCQ